MGLWKCSGSPVCQRPSPDDPGNPAALSLRWSLIASKVAAMETVEQGKLGFHEADLAGVGDTTGRAARSHEVGACPTAACPSELDLFVPSRSPAGYTSAIRRPADPPRRYLGGSIRSRCPRSPASSTNLSRHSFVRSSRWTAIRGFFIKPRWKVSETRSPTFLR
jgi:hypothetical protein